MLVSSGGGSFGYHPVHYQALYLPLSGSPKVGLGNLFNEQAAFSLSLEHKLSSQRQAAEV